jgi:hypothetical protein
MGEDEYGPIGQTSQNLTNKSSLTYTDIITFVISKTQSTAL